MTPTSSAIPVAGPHPRRRVAAWLAVILLLASTTRVLSYSGFGGSDDGNYASIAHDMARGRFQLLQYQGAPVFPLRLGIIMPVRALFFVAGPSEPAVVAYPLLISLLSIALTAIAGMLLVSPRAGLIAATLYAGIPLDASFASMLLPDHVVAFWMGCGVLLMYRGAHCQTLGGRVATGAAAGFVLFVGWVSKETVVYIVPLLVVMAAVFIKRDPAYLAVTAACALTVALSLGAESVYYHIHTGDWLFRYHETERNYQASAVNRFFFAEGSRHGWEPGHYWEAVTRRLLVDGPQTILFNRALGGTTLAATLAIGYAVVRRRCDLALVGGWFLSIALQLNFGSTSLLTYRPLVFLNEYLYPLVLPACVLTASLLDSLLPHNLEVSASPLDRERGFWGLVVATGLALTMVGGNLWTAAKSPQSPVERAVARQLSPSDVLYTDSRTASVLRFFWKYPERDGLASFEGRRLSEIPAGAYVLINRPRMEFLRSVYGVSPPEFYQAVPSQWRLQWRANGGELYQVPTGSPFA